MKKIAGLALVLIVIAAGIGSCKKVVKAVFKGLDLDAPSITVEIPRIFFVPPDEFGFATLTQPFNLDSVVRANTAGAFGASDVSSVKVKQMFFSISNADSENNLSNLESARVAFSSNTNPNPVDIANITFPKNNESSFTYIPENPIELRPFLNGNELRYKVFGKARKMTSKPMTLTVRVTLRVG